MTRSLHTITKGILWGLLFMAPLMAFAEKSSLTTKASGDLAHLSDYSDQDIFQWLEEEEYKHLLLLDPDTVPYDTTESKFKYWDKLGHWFEAYGYTQSGFLTEEAIAFKRSAFVNVYLEPLIDHKHWMFWVTNKITKATNLQKTAPYVLIQPEFVPTDDEFTSYGLRITLKGSPEVQSYLSTIQTQANADLQNASATSPAGFEQVLKTASAKVLTDLATAVGSSLAPPIVIGYGDSILLNGDVITTYEGLSDDFEFQSLDNQLNPLDDSRVSWQNASKNGSVATTSMAGVTRKEVSVSYRGYTSIITIVKRGDMLDLKSILKDQIIAVLRPRKEKYQDTLRVDQENLATLDANLIEQLGLIEKGNLPLVADASLAPEPVFDEPFTVTDSSTFLDSEVRRESFRMLRQKKNLEERVRKRINVLAFADLIVDNPEQLDDLADAIIRNSGRVLAQILFDNSSSGQEERIRNIIVDFLNANIEQMANSSSVAVTAVPVQLPVVEVTERPTFDLSVSRVYMNPLIPMTAQEKSDFITEMDTYLATLDEKVFVNVRYSQDVSTASYQSRATTGRPVGLPEDYDYVNIDYVNIPGSVKMQWLVGSNMTGLNLAANSSFSVFALALFKVGEGFADYECVETSFLVDLIQQGYDFVGFKGEPIKVDEENVFPYAFLGKTEDYYGSLAAVQRNGIVYTYGLKTDAAGQYYYTSFVNRGYGTIETEPGDRSKAVYVQLEKGGNYRILDINKNLIKSGTTTVYTDCPGIANALFTDEEIAEQNNQVINKVFPELDIVQCLTKDFPANDSRHEDVLKLAAFLKSKFEGKHWAFLYRYTAGGKDYKQFNGVSLLCEVLRDLNIYSVSEFQNYSSGGSSFAFYDSNEDEPKYIRDIEILLANFDPWDGIPLTYNRYTFDYTSHEVPIPQTDEIMLEQLDIIEDIFTHVLTEYPDYFSPGEREKFYKFINARRSRKGLDFVDKHKLSEHKQLIAAFEKLGAYKKYHYSILDLAKREQIEDSRFIVAIQNAENAGRAIPIHQSEGYDQYVAKHQSASAFFLGIEYMRMAADVLEFNVVGNAVAAAQKALSKNFRRFSIPRRGSGTASTTRLVTIENRVAGFNKAAMEATGTTKKNVRTLRNWAKSKGYTKKAGTGSNTNQAEEWGVYNESTQQFESKVRIGFDGSNNFSASFQGGNAPTIRYKNGTEVPFSNASLADEIADISRFKIPTGLASKLGNTSSLSTWLGKYGDEISDVNKLLDDLNNGIGNKIVMEVLEDGQKRFSVVLETNGVTHDVYSIQKNVDGNYEVIGYNRAYNPQANTSIDVGVSQNRLTPDYTTNMAGGRSNQYLYPQNQLPQGKSPVVRIRMTGKRTGTNGDFHEANKAAGIDDVWGSKAPDDYVWHHLDDFDPITGECTMQLVRRDSHTGVTGMAHSGSVAQYKSYYVNSGKAPGGKFYTR